MQVDPLLSLLVGALGAALLGLLGAWIQARREHSRWIREQRLNAYLDYIRLVEMLPMRMGLKESDIELLENLRSATAALRLLGPDRVYAAAVTLTAHAAGLNQVNREPDANRDVMKSVNDKFDDARTRLVEAARLELRIRG